MTFLLVRQQTCIFLCQDVSSISSFIMGLYQCCPSVCPVPSPRGKTKRPTNTKLGRKGPWDTSTPWTNFKVNGSEVKVTAANEIPFYNSVYGSGLFMFTVDTQIQYIDIY